MYSYTKTIVTHIRVCRFLKTVFETEFLGEIYLIELFEKQYNFGLMTSRDSNLILVYTIDRPRDICFKRL